MSKGKRKSDPEALSTVYARLRARGLAVRADAPVFSAADRELLLKLCRLDLIHIIEVELALGPLKSSQKNSVGGMVHWLLHQRHRQPAAAAAAAAEQQQQQFDGDDAGADADADDDTPARPGTSVSFRTQGGASSHDASCHTPVQEEEQEEEEAAAAIPVHPAWLEDLQDQLAAAAAAADPSELFADADDSSNEADSKLAHASWAAAAEAQLALQQQPQPQPLQWQALQQAPAAAAAAAPSQRPEDEAAAISQIEQQFLEQLLLDIETKPSSCSLALPAGPQQQLWEQDALGEMTLQQPQLATPQQQQQLAAPQPGGHMWPPMPVLDAAAAAAWPGSSQQVLPTVDSWQRSCELSSSSGSFHSKRDLSARRGHTCPLPALLHAGMVAPASASAAELLYVEGSGPSADLPTKRRSVTLPGTAEVAALPTSFSGRLPLVPSVMAPAIQPGLVQLSALYDEDDDCQPAAAADDGGALAWQLQQPAAQEQRRQSRMAGLAHKIGDLLLHGRTKAKAKRHSSGTFLGSSSTIAIKEEAGAAAPAGGMWAPAAQLGAAQQQQQQQQMLQGGSLVMPCDGQRLLRDPAQRLWNSAIEVPAHRMDSSSEQWPLPAGIGGLSWNAGEAGGQQPAPPPAAAAAPAARGNDFARQLARLRTLYGHDDDEEIC